MEYLLGGKKAMVPPLVISPQIYQEEEINVLSPKKSPDPQMQKWLMTKDWKLFYRGVMTHITYATQYKQKIGLGAAEDASREVGEGTQSPELSLSQKLQPGSPRVSCFICFYETLRCSMGGGPGK